MAERTPREYLTTVLELSRERVSRASIDPGYQLDVDFLGYLSLLLRENGFETQTAFDGHEAVELCSARRPDLLILDTSMRGESGASVPFGILADTVTMAEFLKLSTRSRAPGA